MKLNNLIIASAVSMLATLASAAPQAAKPVKIAKASPNCEVNGKKSHVKDQAACEKKKGKWLDTAAATPVAKEPVAPKEKDSSAPVAAPAPEEKK